MSDFIPRNKGDYYDLLLNVKTQAEAPEVVAALPAADLTTVKAKCTNQIARHAATVAAEAAYKAALKDEENGMIETNFLLREKHADWKRIEGYSPTIATKLGLVPSASAADVPDKVSFKLKLVAGEVRVDWVKGGLHSVNVYSRMAGETAWTRIGWDMSSPYLDSRPLAVAGKPEVRQYMLRGVVSDQEVTEDSDVLEIVVK